MKRCLAIPFLAALALAGHVRAADWNLEMEPDLFPSMVIATSSLEGESSDDPAFFGDPLGPVSIRIESPRDNARVRVTVEGSELIRPSVLDVRLPEKGVVYELAPVLKYNYNALLRVRQPFPETVSAEVKVDGRDVGQQSGRITIRSINDCPFAIHKEDGSVVDLNFLFAAYVNENHPVVDQLLREALDSGDVSSFGGYQGNPDEVLAEIQAIWNALQKRDFAYSSITRPSKSNDDIVSQHVRLIGDSIRSSQANCVDGSVLLASIFRKIGLDPFLVSLPGHMIVGVYLDPEKQEYACIETTLLDEASLADAVKSGNAKFRKHFKKLTMANGDDPEYAIIDIDRSRRMGILPLREPDAESFR